MSIGDMVKKQVCDSLEKRWKKILTGFSCHIAEKSIDNSDHLYASVRVGDGRLSIDLWWTKQLSNCMSVCVYGGRCVHTFYENQINYINEIRGAGFFRVLQNESLSSRSRSKILNSESGFSFFEVWEEFFGKFVFLWPTKSIRRTLL
jgi:hypothetical protein